MAHNSLHDLKKNTEITRGGNNHGYSSCLWGRGGYLSNYVYEISQELNFLSRPLIYFLVSVTDFTMNVC